MANFLVLPQGVEEESDDTPKKFTNIDIEDFEQTWDGKPYVVKAGETGIFPKYLVNVMASNLARKIYKRQAYAAFQGSELEKQKAAIRFVNPVEEMKLAKLMVQENFPMAPIPELVKPTSENIIDKSQVETPSKPTFKCDKCEYVAKSKAGLAAHSRRKHI